MKRKIIKKVLLFMLFICSLFLSNVLIIQAQETQSDFYWSDKNEPIFYGATKIEMSKNAISSFDINDIRFRVFAKDFEDGDLNIECIENNVEVNKVGEYQIKYQVKDSHNNLVTLEVPVKVNSVPLGILTSIAL